MAASAGIDRPSRIRFIGKEIGGRADWAIAYQEPPLLRMPLVRRRQQLPVGDAESIWREWTGR